MELVKIKVCWAIFAYIWPNFWVWNTIDFVLKVEIILQENYSEFEVIFYVTSFLSKYPKMARFIHNGKPHFLTPVNFLKKYHVVHFSDFKHMFYVFAMYCLSISVFRKKIIYTGRKMNPLQLWRILICVRALILSFAHVYFVCKINKLIQIFKIHLEIVLY